MSNGPGGVRPGAGRPKGSVNKVPSKSALAQQKFADLIEPRLEELADVLFEITLDPVAPHSARVAAARELLDRAMGKPREIIDINTGDEELTVANLLATPVKPKKDTVK